jgi:hypothetical protein
MMWVRTFSTGFGRMHRKRDRNRRNEKIRRNECILVMRIEVWVMVTDEIVERDE